MSDKDVRHARFEDHRIRASYDEFPYTSYPLSQTHIAHTGAIATLCGISPPRPEKSRVLEMACASGGNLIPMALEYLDSEFTGVDISSSHIESGKKMIARLGLSNIELKEMSILDVDETLGNFDYIIAHGVYSWVPEAVQEKILEVVQNRLTLNGIAYISYNTYPGWYLNEKFRTMLTYHVRDIALPYEKIDKAFDFMEFLTETADEAWQEEFKKINAMLAEARENPSYFLHEYLELHNSPLYFHQFMQRAKRHGLQYVAEAQMHIAKENSQFKDYLCRKFPAQDFTDPVVLGQHVDFIKNRYFRQTILCHDEVNLDRTNAAERLKSLYAASYLRQDGQQTEGYRDKRQEFQDAYGNKFYVDKPLARAALGYLTEIFPHYATIPELFAAARTRLTKGKGMIVGAHLLETEERELLTTLLSLHESDILYLRTTKPRFVTKVSECPLALPLAREQAKSGSNVTTCRHERCFLERDFTRYLLPYLDGKNDRAALARIMEGFVKNGTLRVLQDGVPASDETYIRNQIEETLHQEIQNIASYLLLIG